MKVRSTILIAAAALLVAATTYAVSREGLRLHDWLAYLSVLPEQPVFVPEPFRNVLPDALWQFAFCLCVFSVWRGAPSSRSARLWIAAPVVIGLGSELGQAVGLIEGVFDLRDLVAMALATVVAAALVWQRPQEKTSINKCPQAIIPAAPLTAPPSAEGRGGRRSWLVCSTR